MILSQEHLPEGTPNHRNPYIEETAKTILSDKRNRDEIQAMIIYCDDRQAQYPEGWAFLSQSPLAHNLIVAGAMVTKGLLEQGESENGACKVRLTDLSRKLLEKAT